ncbi:hypothetical protein QBC41DRAFT_96084 [Cercophora samala]|uniref:Secreted protein n=1 Tax=Cercophora samala TaxID=330535 RepID=A0AA39ZGT7_9PEZI|nr:hypothetical protein QBC41DRAFT_96084 [Cercophora samala]
MMMRAERVRWPHWHVVIFLNWQLHCLAAAQIITIDLVGHPATAKTQWKLRHDKTSTAATISFQFANRRIDSDERRARISWLHEVRQLNRKRPSGAALRPSGLLVGSPTRTAEPYSSINSTFFRFSIAASCSRRPPLFESQLGRRWCSLAHETSSGQAYGRR